MKPVPGAVAGSVVPERAEGVAASALAPEYQRIVSVLESEVGREGMRCQQLTVALGLEAVPAKVEGLRSKARRLVERGRVLQVRPGVITALGVGRLKAPERRRVRLMTMLMGRRLARHSHAHAHAASTLTSRSR
ncbi:hypothetical protein ACFWP7_36230 [Streptomyces sp. NPDC058470]|uniref:hypothetical protein n=1 Tax=Streptomyces sp. NPDC058470 TaxID=3346515 RepID=UPI003665A3AA